MLLKGRAMSLTDLAAIGSFVSSFAVAITLIFLALQVRQAEKNQRAMMQQGRADRISSQALQVASDPALSRLFNKGMQRPHELTHEEVDQFIVLTRALFVSGEDSFLQYKAGMLDKASYQSQIAGLKYMIGAWPGLRAAWRYMSVQYNAGFQESMNDLVRQASAQSAPDRMAQWTAILQAEQSTGAAARLNQAERASETSH
jgi:hypothetical protein